MVKLANDLRQRQRERNLALGGFLLGLVMLFFVITIFKMSGLSAPTLIGALICVTSVPGARPQISSLKMFF